jgi:hypothetical protein
MEEKLILEIKLRRAKNISEFCLENGKRHLNMHYYQWNGSRWLLRWIEPDTDGAWLIEKIEEGVIYIHDSN